MGLRADGDASILQDNDASENKFFQTQSKLCIFLMESFQKHNFMELQSYSYDAVRKRLIAGTFADASSPLAADSLTVRFLPYDTLLYWVLKAHYDEEGTDEVIHLQSNFDTAVVFPKGQQITKSIALKWGFVEGFCYTILPQTRR